MIKKLYEDSAYTIYMWHSWIVRGRPIQIYFCKSSNGACPQDDSFYISKDKALHNCQGLHPLSIEDYENVIRIINYNKLIDKAIDECITVYGSCVYKN